MRKKGSAASLIMFLIGTFSLTQVYIGGAIGISEIFIFASAPFLFCKDYPVLRRDGFLTFLLLAILCCVGCVIATIHNDTPFPIFMRGFMSPYSIFAMTVVFHHVLREHLGAIKWYFLGGALTLIINIFIFQQSAEAAQFLEYGKDISEGIMSGPIFWIARLGPSLRLPIQMAYYGTPLLYSILEPIGWFFFCVLTSESGRSAAIMSLGTVLLVVVGRKSVRRMRLVGRHFFTAIIVGSVLLLGLSLLYKRAALNGWLGEKALAKYEKQTAGRKGILGVLMGGRSEVFIGLYSALHNPIWGYGPWAEDREGLTSEFLLKYGTEEDYEQYLNAYNNAMQYSSIYLQMPSHSHIVGFWIWYGIAGLLLWIYVLLLMIQHIRKYISAIPQWYGIFAISVPMLFWHILFSPFGNRMGTTVPIILMLFSRAVAQGRCRVSPEFQQEMYKFDK